jgi:hypothetical protein
MVRRDDTGGIGTSDGLDGPGIESWCGRGYPEPSRLDLVPTQPTI